MWQKKAWMALAAMSMSSAAMAHVSFADDKATANRSFTATLNIPHGCEVTLKHSGHAETSDTTKVEVDIPASFTSVRPMDEVFAPATVTEDANHVVTKLTWTKAAGTEKAEDSHFYQVTLRGRAPDAPFTKLTFRTVQTCVGGGTAVWEGADVPTLLVLPTRSPGWNKFTAQETLDEDAIKAFFSDARIVHFNGASYSPNAETTKLIQTKLTSITKGGEFWVKY